MVSDATDESLKRGEQRLNILNNVLTKSEGLNATISDISLSFRSVHLKCQPMSSMEEEDFKVLDLSVCEQDDVLAEMRARRCRCHVYSERSLIDRFILESDFLEAAAFVGCPWVC